MNLIISEFCELPKIYKTWRIFFYGFSVVLMSILYKLYNTIFPEDINKHIGRTMGEFYWSNLIGPCIMFIELLFFIYSIKIGIDSFKKGERSWILWIGFLHIVIIIILGLSYYNFIPNIF